MSGDKADRATVKGWLAALGQDVHPQASLRRVTPPPAGQSLGQVVVLERVRKGEKPEYCLHGYASCIHCRELCWLGHETEKVVSSGKAWALCVQCATKVIPPDSRQPIGHLKDHLRKDGPHDD